MTENKIIKLISDERTRMSEQRIKYLLKELRKANPYPEDIFPKRTTLEYAKFNTALAEAGITPDGFFAQYGRDLWNQCIEKLIELITENEEE